MSGCVGCESCQSEREGRVKGDFRDKPDFVTILLI